MDGHQSVVFTPFRVDMVEPVDEVFKKKIEVSIRPYYRGEESLVYTKGRMCEKNFSIFFFSKIRKLFVIYLKSNKSIVGSSNP